MTAAIAAAHPNAALASALLAPGPPRRPCIQVAAINASRPPSATPATYTSPLSRQRLPATAMQQARAKEVPLTAPARYLLTPSACVAGPGAARHQTATNAHQNAHGRVIAHIAPLGHRVSEFTRAYFAPVPALEGSRPENSRTDSNT